MKIKIVLFLNWGNKWKMVGFDSRLEKGVMLGTKIIQNVLDSVCLNKNEDRCGLNLLFFG